MKKVSIFMAIAAAASLASCTAQAPKANLKSDIDSLSYSIGMAQTQGLKGYLTGRLDVDTAYMADFIKGLNEGANKTSKKDIAYMAGLQIGQQISNQMMKGINQELFGTDSTKTISKENFMAGFIAGTLEKGGVMTMDYWNAFWVGGLICALVQILLDKTKLMPGRVMVLLVCTGAFLGALGIYQPLIDFAGAGASVPLLGFGNTLWKGLKEAIDSDGFIGLFTGGFTACAAGISAALIFSYLASWVFKPKMKE